MFTLRTEERNHRELFQTLSEKLEATVALPLEAQKSLASTLTLTGR